MIDTLFKIGCVCLLFAFVSMLWIGVWMTFETTDIGGMFIEYIKRKMRKEE